MAGHFRRFSVECNGMTVSYCSECNAIIAASSDATILAFVEGLHRCGAARRPETTDIVDVGTLKNSKSWKLAPECFARSA